MRHPSTPAVLVFLLPPLLASCGRPGEGFARAYEITSLDEAIGGPKAIAQPGDLILENHHARVAIVSNRNSLGPGLYGGGLVDADIRRSDPSTQAGQGNDQFAEMFATANMNVPEPPLDDPDAVRITKEGGDGEAIVRVEAPATAFISLLDALWAIVASPDLVMATEYIARADEPWFRLRTTIGYGITDPGELGAGEPAQAQDDTFPLIDWAIESGVVLGDFYLQGGSIDVFAPGIGFDEDGAVFEAMQRGENTFVDPFQFPFLAGVGDGVSYGLAPADGDLFIPLFTASQTVAVGAAADGDGTDARFPAGTQLTYERFFFVGHGDVGSIVDQYIDARKLPHGTVSGHVLEKSTAAPLSGVDVFVFEPGAEMPWSQWTTDIHPDDRSPDGSFSGQLPVGEWELLVHDHGRPDGKRVPITVKKGGDVQIALEAGRFGVVDLEIRDETGRLVPAKVSLFRVDDKAPTRRPALGDAFIAGSPEAVVFAMYGTAEVELPPGEYVAYASRGLEYEIDISDVLTVDENTGAMAELQVVRSVETDGWVSADLHVHALRSHDSGVALADRVRTMVCEGVEFFASTDHDFLVDYAPTVEALGMEEWVQTAVGNETTTVEVGHFLAFPLGQDFMVEAGGGRDEVDWTGKKPQEMIDSLRTMGAAVGADPLVFVGHPRDGILGYFDQYGLDPYSGQPGSGGSPGIATIEQPLLNLTNPLLVPGNISWDFDGLELLNAKRFELMRTPTQPEMDSFAAGDGDVWDWMTRTMSEQEDLADGVYRLGSGVEGHIDDWFTLLNLGFRFTALGNSDTHGTTSTESGCPRNFVLADEDDPAFLDDQAVADAVKEHRVVASYGPFVRMWIDEQPIGSEVVPSGDTVSLHLDVQAPTWMDVSRVELYENGTLIREWAVEPTGDVYRFDETVDLSPVEDSWYVAIVAGEEDMAPLFTPVEIPYVELQLIVTEALGGVESVSSLVPPAIPVPREFPIRPYALTNPIWVDLAGDGFDAPGIPDWLVAPE